MFESIDIHAHYLPINALKQIRQRSLFLRTEINENGQRLKLTVAEKSSRTTVNFHLLKEERIIKDMDSQRLRKRIFSLSPLALFYNFSAGAGIQLCRMFNDSLSELAMKHPERLDCMCVVPLQNPTEAVHELRRAVQELGLKGVLIGSNVNGRNLDDDIFVPFFREASRIDIPIFIHPVSPRAGIERLSKYYLSNLLGNPIETTIASTSLILGGILQRFPRLKVLLAHGGGFLPYQIGRLDHGFKNRSEPSEVIRKLPVKFMQNLFFDTITHNQEALLFLIRQVGSGHVLLGSDYPADMGYEQPVRVVEKISAASVSKSKILSENASKLFDA